MVTIAVDAMGGDKAPVPEIAGAIHAAREYGHRIFLVGDGPVVEKELSSHSSARDLPSTVVHASERITMDDHAAKAARGKKASSMHVCARLVADGQANGFLSAGNTAYSTVLTTGTMAASGSLSISDSRTKTAASYPVKVQ